MLETANASSIVLSNAETTPAELHDEGRLVIASDGMKSIVTVSIADNFVRLLPKTSEVERVFWNWEGDVLRIWTVVSRRSPKLQRQIYEAESTFLDAFPDRPTDFSVVFREGRSLSDLMPTHAREIAFLEE